MISDEILDKIADSISGTCDFGDPLHKTIDYYLEREATHEELKQVEQYLDDQGIMPCDQCGWYTFPGEGDGSLCEDCLSENEDSDLEDND
jgi:hypothetical protein